MAIRPQRREVGVVAQARKPLLAGLADRCMTHIGQTEGRQFAVGLQHRAERQPGSGDGLLDLVHSVLVVGVEARDHRLFDVAHPTNNLLKPSRVLERVADRGPRTRTVEVRVEDPTRRLPPYQPTVGIGDLRRERVQQPLQRIHDAVGDQVLVKATRF